MTKAKWNDIRDREPPANGHGLVVLVQITCPCGKGGQLSLSAGRIDGEWVIEPFEHSFEIDYWMQLPAFPPLIKRAWLQ